MLNDVRHALRMFSRAPAFALTAVITLAVGIGATTGVFSIYSAVLLRPLPFGNAERIVAIWVREPAGGVYGIAGGTLMAVRSLPSVDNAAVTIGTEKTLLGAGEPEVLRGALVSAEFFDVLRVRPAIGRLLDKNDSGGTASPVVLSHRLWQRRFNSDPSIVGRPFRLDDTVHTVVGILPPAVRYPEDADYWVPYSLSAADLSRTGRGPFTGIARLRSSNIDAASAQAGVLSASAADRDAGSVMFVPLVESLAGPYRSTLTLLLAAVLMVLLIACFNVANLVLAQNTARKQEFAIRRAIGATRWRLLRQLLAESFALAFMGTVAGVLVAQVIGMSLSLLGVPQIPRIHEVSIDWRVLSFGIVAAVGSVCIFGIVPAWLATRRFGSALGVGQSAAGPNRRMPSNVLIALQVAATLALLVGSALALMSLYRLHSVDLGFDTRHLTVTTIRPSATTLKGPGIAGFYERLVGRLQEMDGLQAVATMSHVPLEPILAAAATVSTEDGIVLRDGRNGPRMRVVSPRAFQVLGVPIIRGRDFAPADRAGAPLVSIVNETLARRLWNDEDPIGKSLIIESRGSKRPSQVVGVARDFRSSIRRVPQPEVYLAAAQEPSPLKLVVRSELPPDVVAARIRGAILSEDPEVPITGIATANSLVWDGAAYVRFQASLLTAFGVFAALLASSGILAVVMYTVARRTREIGMRIAIGASPQQVVRLFVRETTVPLVCGLAAGLFAVYSMTTLLQQQGVLFEVRRFEPGLYAGVTLALFLLALVAAWIPARRAALIEPMVALRSE
jgi:predicted permease